MNDNMSAQYQSHERTEFSAERDLYVGNTYFEQKNLHKYTRVARCQNGVEIKSMIDLVLVRRGML